MGLFQKNEEEREKRPVNPNGMAVFRIMAVAYLLYIVFDLIKMYIKGGEDAPSLILVICTAVVFVGVSVWICWMTYHQYQDLKAEQALEAERMAEEELALEAQRIAEEEAALEAEEEELEEDLPEEKTEE